VIMLIWNLSFELWLNTGETLELMEISSVAKYEVTEKPWNKFL